MFFVNSTNNPESWKAEVDNMVTDRHITAAWVAVGLNPLWAINDFLVIPSHWLIFFCIRIIVSLFTVAGILYREKLNLKHETVVLIPFLGICLQNAYMYSVMDAGTLQLHTFAYIAIFIGGSMLLVWPVIYSIAVVVITFFVNAVLFKLLSPLSVKEMLMNGGLLTFTVAILTIVLTYDRFRSVKKEVIARLALAESNNKILEQKNIIEKQVDELNLVNQKLGRFAYMISHDLKAPLRAVKNLSSWIESDAADVLTGESADHLKLLSKQVTKMDMLINGVLNYSKASQNAEEKERINLNELVNEIIEGIYVDDSVTIAISSELPVVYSNKVSQIQVFQNLLSNAVKHNNKDAAFVEIGCSEKEHCYELFVRDNGPGIAPEHREKVFELFQTLHQGKSDSTGIGLSIVKKIVEDAGGKIWIESDPGKGACFYFTFLKTMVEASK